VPTKLLNKFNKQAAAIPPLRFVTEDHDATLVAAAEGGHDQAFGILVGRYQKRILNVAMRFTRNREDAEDIVQQSFQKAFIHLQQFEGNSSFSTWVTRIAINEALMWLRRKRVSSEVPIQESSTNNETPQALDFPDSGPNPEESSLQRERERILSAAMNELTPGMRTAIELRELGELSTEETARVMGLSIGAVKSRVFHGRRKLREVLKRYVESTWRYGNQALRTRRKANGISRHQLVCSAGD
jgi:RNA polymerase sigma-70 factor (ECF subfamily)